MSDTLPAHSPLGASSADRWMHCPGSIELLKTLPPEEDEKIYAAEGTAAHSLAAFCLMENVDAWERVGENIKTKRHDIPVTDNMVDAVQVYLDVARPLMAQATATRIEHKMHCPTLHPSYFGTADLVCYNADTGVLDISDYKHGVGVVVDASHNPQLRYYGRGMLEIFREATTVHYRIVQPRAFHPDGIIREWEESADSLRLWADTELLPKMRNLKDDNQLYSGDWCRFCPAKLICPLLGEQFQAVAKADPEEIAKMGAEELGRLGEQLEGVATYARAVKQEIERCLMDGERVPGWKLVVKRADRVFKEGAETALAFELGKAAYHPPALKSPAQLEKISTAAKDLVKQWAETPAAGLTVAQDSDRRAAATPPRPASEVFADAIKKLGVDNVG